MDPRKLAGEIIRRSRNSSSAWRRSSGVVIDPHLRGGLLRVDSGRQKNELPVVPNRLFADSRLNALVCEPTAHILFAVPRQDRA